jgi:arabinoxylan arabinofuranohydrolase
MTTYSLMSSDDLTNWRDDGIVFDIANTTWGLYAWAQQVIAGTDGRFYMYYPGMRARSAGNTASGIGVAVSASVNGPFLDALGHPLYESRYGNDPTVFRDDDGQVYLCLNSGGPLCARLAANMTALTEPPTQLQPALPNWYEAPWLSKWKGDYFLSYMCSGDGLGNFSHYGWDICYGSCSGAGCSPLGPYVFRGSLMWNPPGDCGPVGANCSDPRAPARGENNHQGIVEFPAGSGRLYLAYHSRTLSKSRGAYLGYQRNVAIDRLYARGDAGTHALPRVPWAVNDTAAGAGAGLLPVTATPAWTRQLKYVNPFAAVPGTLSAFMSAGLDSEACAEGGGRSLVVAADNATTTLRGLDFGDGGGGAPLTLTLRAATPLDGVVVRLEAGAGGQLLAECAVRNSGAWDAWANSSCAVAALSGVVPALTLRFRLPSGGAPPPPRLLGLQYFVFSGGAGAPPAPPRTPPPVSVPLALRSAATGLFWDAGGDAGAVTPSAAAPQRFVLDDAEDGTYTLAAAGGALLCVAADGGAVAAKASATRADPCTRFFLYGTTDGAHGLLAAQSGLFLAAATPSTALAASMSDPRTDAAGDSARHYLIEIAP